MKGKARWWRLVLIAIGLILLLPIGLFTAAWLALRSPDVQQRILGSLREPLQKAGITLDVASLSLDIFAGLNLENLHVRIQKPPTIDADLTLARLRLGYSLRGILQKRLEVSEILVEGLRGDVKLMLPEQEKPPEEPSQGLGPLIDLLRHPPIELDGPSLIVRDNQLQLELAQGPRLIKVALNRADIDAAIALKPALLVLSLKAGLDLGLDFQQQDQTQARLQLKSGLALEPEIQLSVRSAAPLFDWDLELKNLDLQLQSTALTMQGADASSTSLGLRSLKVQPEISLKRQGPIADNPQVNDVLWPLTAKGAIDIDLSQLSLSQKKAAQKLLASLSLSSRTSFDASLLSATPGRDQNWELKQNLKIAALNATQNDKTLAQAKSLDLDITSEGQLGEGRAAINLDLSPLTSSFLRTTVALKQDLNLGFSLSNPAVRLLGSTHINGEKILELNGEGSDRDGLLQSKLQLKLTPHPSLAALHAALAQMDQLGWPALELKLSQHIQHPIPLSQLDKNNWQELTITNLMTADIRQQRASSKSLVRFKKAQLDSNLSVPARGKNPASAVDWDIKLEADGLQHAALRKAVKVQQNLRLKARVGERIDGDLDGQTKVDGFDLLGLKLAWQDKKGELQSQSSLTLGAEPSLQKIVEAAKALDELGGLRLSSQHKLTLVHGAHRLQELKGLDIGRIKADLQMTQTLEQTPVGQAKRSISWQQPLRLDSRVKLNQGAAELITRLSEPLLTAKDQASVRNLQTLIKASLTNVEKPENGEVKMTVDAASVELLRDMPDRDKLHKVLRDFKVIFHGVLSRKDLFTIKTLFVGLHDKLLQFKGQGAFHLNSQGHFDGMLDSQIGSVKDGPIQGSGRLQVPIKLVLFDKTRLSADAEPRFQNFSLEYGDIAVKNLNGGIRVHEELQVKDGRIGFLYLDTQNPFARVDYDSLEPYVGQRAQLSLEQFRFKHISAGPFVENFEVRQNLILLNELKADLLQGSALGRLYLDLHPDRLQMGFLGRFSGIQGELLKEPAKRWPKKDWAPLSGRMALNFDIRKRLATGRLDLTEIGQRQLLSLLDVLDPEYKDDQMVMARRALHIAYPQGVAISMDQGLMDMKINLGGAISKDIVIRSIPLTGLINAKAGEALQQIEKLLQSGGP